MYQRNLLTVIISASILAMTVSQSQATTITKGDNTTTLDLVGSWTGGIAPGAADVANWSGAYTTAGSLSATIPASTGLTWQGISVGSITGTAAGLVSIGGAGAATTGSSLTIGASGIDMSAANQNLVINVATLVFSGDQTWTVATGRNLRFGNTGTGAANANIDSSGSPAPIITIAGGGVVDLNQGGSSGFSDAAGFAGFNGKWVVNSGTTLRGLRNGATAFGTNTAADAITLNGGTLAVGGISGTQGNWTWNTPITLAASTTSSLDQQIFTGTGRFLKLMGAISGSGNLVFKETGATDSFGSNDLGYIIAVDNPGLTNANTITIGGATENGISGRLSSVRVGGVNGATDITTFAGNAGTLGTATIVNNGVLTFSRTDTHTVANNISGTGNVRFGSSGIATSSTQAVTLTGTNSYSGGTELQNGSLTIDALNKIGTGYLAVKNGATFRYTGTGSESTTRNLFMDSGAATINIVNATGALTWTTETSTKTGTFTKDGPGSLSISGPFSGAASITVTGGGTLTLGGTGTYTGTTSVTNGTLALTGTGRIGDTSAVTVNGSSATLNIGAINDTIGNLTLTNGTISGTGGTLTSPLVVLQSGSVSAGLASTAAFQKGTDGTVTLTGNNNGLTGGLTFFNGSLLAGHDNALGTGTVAFGASTSASAAALSLLADGPRSIANAITVGNNATTDIASWTIGQNSADSSTFSGTITTLAAKTLTVTAPSGGAVTFTGTVTGTGGITKTGSGTATFASTATTTYTDPTTITAGKLIVNTNLTSSSGTTVGSTATLAGSGTLGAVTVTAGGTVEAGTAGVGDLTLTSLTLDSGATTLKLTPAAKITTTALTANGATTVNIGSVAPSVGQYTLIDYLSTIGGNGISAFSLASIPRVNMQLVENTTNTSIDLNVIGVDKPKWTGAADNQWDTSAVNWTEIISTNPTAYIQGDDVLFDDTATGSTSVVLNISASPAAITFNNSVKAYDLSGIGKLTGSTGLVKNGTNVLTLSNVGGNDFTGATQINAGTLRLGNATALSPNSTLSLGSNAFLDLNGNSISVPSIAGSGTVKSDTAAATLTFNNTANTTFAGVLADGTGSLALTKSGTGTLTLTGTNTANGAVQVTAGTLQVGDGTTGSLAVTAPISTSGTGVLALKLPNNATFANAVTNDGTISSISTGTTTLSGAITGAGTVTLAGPGATTISGAITGAGSLLQSGASTTLLTTANAYTGTTTINSGTLKLDKTAGGKLYATGAFFGVANQNYIIVNSGGTFSTWNWNYGDAFALSQLRNNYGQIQINGGTLQFDDTMSSQRAFTIGASGATLEVTAGNTYAKLAGSIANENIIRTTAAGTLTLTGAGNGVIEDALGTNGATGFGLVKNGTGTWTLSGASTYTGGTVINAGKIVLGNGFGIGKSGSFGGQLTLHDGTFDTNGMTNYSNNNQTSSPTTWLTTATVTLGGTAGATPQIIDSGATPKGIAFANGTALVYDATNNPGMATIAATWTQSGSSNAASRSVNVGDSTATAVELDFTGGLGDPTAWDGSRTTIQKTGPGTLRISSANHFPGLRVTAGKVIVNHIQALGADHHLIAPANTPAADFLLTVDGGTLDMNGFNSASGGLSDNGLLTGVITNNGATASTLSVGSSNANTTFGGTLQDGTAALALTKTGTGALTLSGTNTYTGITTISGGTVIIATEGNLGVTPSSPVANQLTLDNGTLQINSGLTLSSNRGITLAGTTGGLNINAGQTVNYAGIVAGTSFTKSGSGTLNLTGANTYTGNTTVSAGALNVPQLNNSTAATTVAANAQLSTNRIIQNSLTLQGSSGSNAGIAIIRTSGTGSSEASGLNSATSQVNTLAIDNDGGNYGVRNYYATLDLGNNDLVVNNTTQANDGNNAAQGTTASQLIQVQDMVRSGIVGNWTGTGIRSSYAANSLTNLNGATGLGVIRNVLDPMQAFGVDNGAKYGAFDGLTLPGDETLVKFTWYGDFDLDGQVTSFDFALLDAGFAGAKQLDQQPGWVFGDANYDGQIDSNDYALAVIGYNNFAAAPNTFTNLTGTPGAALPEPSSLLLGLLGIAGLLATRRRVMRGQ